MNINSILLHMLARGTKTWVFFSAQKNFDDLRLMSCAMIDIL